MTNNSNNPFVPFPANIETRELMLEVLMERAEQSLELMELTLAEFFTYSNPHQITVEDYKEEILAQAASIMNDIDDLKSGMDALTLDRMNGKGQIYERESARINGSVH